MTRPSFLPANPNGDLLPARMCNELVYCERLFHLEHVQGIFVDSADTIAGRGEHERAGRRGRRRRSTTDADAELPPWPDVPRTLDITSDSWGVRGKVDFIEVEDDQVFVLELKHGRAPKPGPQQWRGHELPEGVWPADTAQVGLYMALLRDHGVDAQEGRIYYRGSSLTATIEWSSALERFLHEVVRRAREVTELSTPPTPLRDSPKCPGCSLHGVCLPDEHYALVEQRAATRRLPVARDTGCVVHVSSPGSTVRKQGDAIRIIDRDGEETRVLTKDISHISIFGPSQITAQTFAKLLREGIGVSHHTSAGTLMGMSQPVATRNVGLRRAQYRTADDPSRCLEIARALVIAKVRNQRTVVRRQLRVRALGASAQQALQTTLDRMQVALRSAEQAGDLDVLRGHEGDAARCYFEALPGLLPPAWSDDFRGRSRRPPRDRVNAMLSFAYSLLTREAIAAAARTGLEPMLGFFHSMIPGRPALALDLIEPFRPAWADTAIIRLIATEGIEREHFHVSGAGVYLSDAGRRRVIAAHERRAREETTHPRFCYRMTYRRILELELRVLGKYILGECEAFVPLWTR